MNKHDFRRIWLSMPVAQRHDLATNVGSTYKYLQKLAGGFGTPSMAFADRLRKQLPDLDYTGFQRARKSAGRRLVYGA